jgi:hypothetical protein
MEAKDEVGAERLPAVNVRKKNDTVEMAAATIRDADGR